MRQRCMRGGWEYDAGYLAEAIELEAGPRGAAKAAMLASPPRRESPDGPRVTHLAWMTANVVLYACSELLLVDKEGWLLGKAMCAVRAVTSLSVGEAREHSS